jgi:hypothetical protein
VHTVVTSNSNLERLWQQIDLDLDKGVRAGVFDDWSFDKHYALRTKQHISPFQLYNLHRTPYAFVRLHDARPWQKAVALSRTFRFDER